MKRKFSIVGLLLITAAVIATAATVVGLTVIELPEKGGGWSATGISVAKPVHVEAAGLLPADGTLIIKRVIGTTTNTIYSGSAASGVVAAAVTTTNYICAGDTLIRDGTCTNGIVRLILEGD